MFFNLELIYICIKIFMLSAICLSVMASELFAYKFYELQDGKDVCESEFTSVFSAGCILL